MRNIYARLLLLLILGFAYSASAQDISGETNIVPGQSYSYSYTGYSCNSPSYSWSVAGGVISTNDNYGTITVTWDCAAPVRQIDVSIEGEEYDPEYGYSYSVYCGTTSLTNFTTIPPTAGGIYLSYYNFFLQNEICPNEAFMLGYSGSSGVQQVNWFRWDGTAWQAEGTSSFGPDFFGYFSGITSTTTYKAQPIACGGVPLAEQTITIQVTDVASAGGVALGSRDVLFGANEGTVTLADSRGIIINWQRSTNSGITWEDMTDTGEEINFSNLTTTTLFRAKSYFFACQQTPVYSQPCAIRVEVGPSNLSWIENKSYDEGARVVSNSRSYFDLSGRLLQSQTRNISQGKILATQPLFSAYDQAVGTTLAAPITDVDFTYKPRFVSPFFTASLPYNHNHFDSGSTLNGPVAVGGNTPGTLGWYYSTNNTLEPNTAVTAYPYSRMEEAADGSTGVVRSSGVGEVFRMGQGRENVQGSFSVRAELTNYAQLRSRYFPASVAGEQPASLSAATIQQVSINSNGQKVVTFQDKEGHALMVARPGRSNDWLSVTNTAEVGWPYCFVKTTNEIYENPLIEASADIVVYDENYVRLFAGHARDFNATLSARAGSCRIYCNEPFRITTGRILNATTREPISWNSMYELLPTKREAYAYFNFYTFETGKTSITPLITSSDYIVTNTITGADVTTTFKNGSAIPAGFYQVRIIQGAVSLSYTNDYQDISYSFYNQKGQLLGSLAPNGVKKLLRIGTSTVAGPTSPSLTAGLVAWLPFDEASGNIAADASGNGKHATLNGSTWSWKPSEGSNNGALELTGSSYLYVPVAWQPSAFTVSWWTKPYQRFPYNQMVAADCGWGGFMFHTDWNGEAYVGTDLGSRIVLGANTVALNVWQQFTFTYNAGEGRLYKDGQLLAVKQGMTAPQTWRYFTFGTGPGGQPSEGLLDDCRVYDRALSESDAKELYQSRLPFFTSYEYDVRGQLRAMNETDAGRTKYYYRVDGTLRFSQNAKQQPLGYFSYTNYDDAGRPVEAGECRPISSAYFATIAESSTVLESVDPRGGFALEHPRQDVVLTSYDLPLSLPGLSGTYTQEFLAGRVSNTRKYSTFAAQGINAAPVSQTWFSYDEQGRTKWVVRQQFNQAAHTLDYDYDLNDNVLSVCYQKNIAANRFTHYYSYDPDQRLSEVRTNTADPTNQTEPRKLQASYSYYLHGPLKRAVIGGLQGVDYLYTAQGWLKSINGLQPGSDPATDGPTTSGMLPDLFSQELEYYAGDYYSARRTQGSFTSSGNHPDRFDGTARAQVWRTSSRPTAMSGYGYRYDERGQLIQADYGQLTPGAGGNTSFIPDAAGRYQEGGLTYDPNGNLGDLRRTDRVGANLMNIKYEYIGNTNKLSRVYNPQSPGLPVLEYTYDALGQMTSQVEPGKPKYFNYDVTGKVTDVYRTAAKATTDLIAHYDYDEFGQRIRQTVYNAQQVAETTEYVRDVDGNEIASYYVEPGTNILRLAEQPVYGATRVGVVRQPRNEEVRAELYELNDQLGNTRVVFQAPRTVPYTLTMENGQADQEKKDFPTPNATTYDQVRSNLYARGDTPDGTGYSMRLSAQIGPGKKLAVAPGDRVLLEVWAGYPSMWGVINGRASVPNVRAIGLASAALLVQPQPRLAESGSTRALPAWQRLLSQVSVGVAIPLTGRQPKTYGAAAKVDPMTPTTLPPNAVLRYTLRLVRDRSIVREGTARVAPAAEGQWQPLNLSVTIDTEEPAELEVWLQNFDAQPVYFDDMRIEHQVGTLVAENHFYPYGQRNEGLSWTRQYMRGYGRGYQGQNTRFDEETGYDNFELRMYDARIGRWLSMDPMGQFHSPYVGMGNDPVNMIDPDGGFSDPTFPANPKNEQTYIDPGTKQAYIYFNGSWSHSLGEVAVVGARAPSPTNFVNALAVPSIPWKTQYREQKPHWTNCCNTVKKMVSYVPASRVYITKEANSRLVLVPGAAKGLKKLDEYLANGTPVMIGVHHTYNAGYNEGTTDHFVLAVSGNTRIGIRFSDVGTLDRARGTAPSNMLYMNPKTGMMTGSSAATGKTYTLSQLRFK
ncbi:LamG-like jellyroll fold domain-containing protein [Hymenobacter elongatus]|uniref:RHS repeat-associated core domain-containing protein n=1 Tax=Hymenobacter elongatus TaxID=877208 RepID=A0A4Z0PPR5_9BACT|nr:LamG-like jellyroll fold domain-containing protein [Hymenobacter elongatus]TGE17546.1 hypothetical protein E5J99_06750 [Hymenobacter elongatus]